MGFLLYSNTQIPADSSIWKCPIRWLFQSPFKKPPIALYFTHLQQFALIIFRSKNILLHTCLNVMEIAEKEKQKKILPLLTNIRSRKTKRILKLKKTVVFQTMSTKKPPILTFLPTSNSSFKLTE